MAELLGESRLQARLAGPAPPAVLFEQKRWRSVDKAFDVLKLQKAPVFPRHAPALKAAQTRPGPSQPQADPALLRSLQRELDLTAPETLAASEASARKALPAWSATTRPSAGR